MSAAILVVDDEAAVRDMLKAWLEAGGYACSEAPDAESALEHLATHHVDVALLDLVLPGRDGVWLAREMRERAPDVGLVLVTGVHRFDIAVEGMRIGVLDYLLKPFSRRDLIQAVRRAVEWRESLRRDRERDQALRRVIASRRDALARAFETLDQTTPAALARVLDTAGRDHPEACAHARRVAAMAVELARVLGVDRSELADIERGALLHDVGKLAMPEALMQKPGPLADEDIALIRTHVDVGRQIVRVVPALAAAAEIVAASHEAWDGSGYPRGLAGDEIPLGARIVAVVDTFDALAWNSRGDRSLTYARAAAELVRCAGSQFDPDVVHAWLRVADSYPPPAGPIASAGGAAGIAPVQATP